MPVLNQTISLVFHLYLNNYPTFRCIGYIISINNLTLVMKNNWVPPLPNGKGIYGNKDRSLPRFIYRRLFHALSSAKSRDERMHILRSMSQELIDCRGEMRLK